MRAEEADRGWRRPAFVLNIVVVIIKINISRSTLVGGDKVTIAWGTFVFCVGSKHALYAHAYALHGLHRRPTLCAQKVKTDDSVAINMRVDWDGPWGVGGGREFDELNFWRL